MFKIKKVKAVFVALLGYSFLGIEAAISKFLVSGRIRNWQIYSFYIGIFSLFAFFLIPFGLNWFGWEKFFLSVFAGFLFFISLILLYQALEKEEASRVFTIFGSTSILVTYLMEKIVKKDVFLFWEIGGIGLLLLGGILVLFNFKKKSFFSFVKELILGGILMAFALIFLQFSYQQQNFVTGYVFSRLGIVIVAAIFLFDKNFYQKIKFYFLSNNRKVKKDNLNNVIIVFFSKGLAGLGTFLIHLAINWSVSVAIINAISSFQYAVTFVLVSLLSIKNKKIWGENLEKRTLVIKTIGILFISLGIFLISTYSH